MSSNSFFTRDDEERRAAAAAKKADRETRERGKAVLGTDRFGRVTTRRAAENLDNLREEALRGLEQNREARGKLGIVSQEAAESSEYKEGRKQRAGQDSTNRRLIREIDRAKQFGRVSSWLQRYSAQKEAEFNSQNAVLQSLPPSHGSIRYNRFGSDDVSGGSSSGSSRSSSSSSPSLPTPPSSGTYVLGSINGSLRWIGTSSC